MPNERRARHKEGHRQRQAELREAQLRANRRRTYRAIGIIAVLVIGVALAVSLTSKDDDGDDKVEAGDETTTTVAGDDTAPPAGDEEAILGPDGSDGASPFVYGNGDCPAEDGSGERVIDFDSAPKLCIDPAKAYTAVFTTDQGVVRVQLDTTRTPGTTNNFVTLARNRYYDDTSLFRTEKATGIIQGGSPHTDDNSDPGPGYALFDEGGPFVPAPEGQLYGPFQSYPPGTLAMARTAGPDSAGGQFFFVARDAEYLGQQGTYVQFGKVTEGLDVLEKIADLDDGEGKPTQPVKIQSIEIEES
jgi:cyclophilin family peptidyl-prolyl cis-trans isomerase